jgi:excisionase family DNA binding protein
MCKIITEAQMKNNPCQSVSRINVLNSYAGGSQTPLISVAEAARRLGVSKSTIYRFDRKNGPFRFVADRRRIFIDLASFEIHLTSTPGIEPVPSLQTDEGQHLCPQEREAEKADLETREVPVVAIPAAPASDPVSLWTWCGPREPIVPKRSGAFVVFYNFPS